MAKVPPPLGPPKMKTLERTQKNPLPPIGSHDSSTPERNTGLSSPSGDDNSPPLSGSIALARRRQNRSAVADECASANKNAQPSTLISLLDPDVDGSPSSILPPAGANERSPGHLAPLHPNK